MCVGFSPGLSGFPRPVSTKVDVDRIKDEVTRAEAIYAHARHRRLVGQTLAHMRALPSLPARVGPAEFGELGRLVAVRAPRELDGIFRRAGGTWEPGSRRWLIERRRIGPVIRALRSTTDPLFRRTGVSLD
jgi:hypothetical protein